LLCSTVWQGRCQLCDTVPPTPVRLTRRALEGGPAAPSNIFYVLIQGHAVTSGRRDRSSPSLSTFCGHPRHCRTTPNTMATSQRYGDKTSPQRPLCHVRAPRQRNPPITPPRRPVNQPLRYRPRSRSCTGTGRTTTRQQERDSPGCPSAPRHCLPYLHT
jgi:hypothetical protein